MVEAWLTARERLLTAKLFRRSRCISPRATYSLAHTSTDNLYFNCDTCPTHRKNDRFRPSRENVRMLRRSEITLLRGEVWRAVMHSFIFCYTPVRVRQGMMQGPRQWYQQRHDVKFLRENQSVVPFIFPALRRQTSFTSICCDWRY